MSAIPIVALFYSVVSLHYQIPIYLFYTVGITLVALFWMVQEGNRGTQRVAVAGSLVLAAIAIHFHAGQPLRRGLVGVLTGQRLPLVKSESIHRCGLWIDDADLQLYAGLQRMIQREVPPHDSIFALPMNPELYYLGQRRNPFRFFNTTLGIRNESDLLNVLDQLREQPPKLVFFRPEDKYNSQFSLAIIDQIRSTYDLGERIGGFEIYRRNDARALERKSGRTAQALNPHHPTTFATHGTTLPKRLPVGADG